MEVIISKNNGFCKGVSRAVETAKKVFGDNVYILGELIHNEQVVDQIKALGTHIVDDISQIANNSTVIIRSHGEPKRVYDALKIKNCEIIDCTCPFVKNIHKIVQEKSQDGYKVVILGEPNHPEVIGINGWCKDNDAIVLSDFDPKIDFSVYPKLCVVSQTTFSVEKYKFFLDNFDKNQCKTLEFFETICYTTFRRQKEAEELSKKCDAIVIIGGQKSSNTRKLFNICASNCKNVFFVSKASELDARKLLNFYKIGIVTGASTPPEQSMEVLTNMADVTEVKTEKSIMEEAIAQFEQKESFKRGEAIKATIISATDSGLYLSIGSKTEVLLEKDDLSCETYDKEAFKSSIGDEIEVLVIDTKPKLRLSQKAIVEKQKEEKDIQEIIDGKIFTVIVTGTNKGGLTAKLGSFEVFIPSSQIRIGFVKDLEKYVGKTLRLKAESVQNQGRRKQIVASQRVILEAEKAERDAIKAEKEDKFFASINVDDIVKGTVVRFASFGAFVEVDGFDCLAHVSDLSWTNVKNPADVLEIGKEYEFVVLKADKETKKVSIGYKQLLPRPWDGVCEKYAVGDVINGKVVRIVPFGVFVEVEQGVDGLVHISQISHEWLENPTSTLTVGQEVSAKIIGIDHDKEKITLSIKATQPAPENPTKPAKEKKDESSEDKPKRKARREKSADADGEVREWKDTDFGGASIAELINKNN